MRSSTDRRLLHHLTAVGAMVGDERPSADERLAVAIGPEHLRAVRSQLAASRRLGFERFAPRLARLRQWQWSVFIVTLGCGAAVSLMGVIELIWQLRSVLAGVGAVAFALAVHLKTRRHRVGHWVGS